MDGVLIYLLGKRLLPSRQTIDEGHGQNDQRSQHHFALPISITTGAVSDSISQSIFFFPLFFVLKNKAFFLPSNFSSLRAQGALYCFEDFTKTVFTLDEAEHGLYKNLITP